MLNSSGLLGRGLGKLSKTVRPGFGDLPVGGRLEIAEEGALGPYLPRDMDAGGGGADWITQGDTPTWADEGDGTGKITCDGVTAQDIARWHPPNLTAEVNYTFVVHVTAIAGDATNMAKIDPGGRAASSTFGASDGPGYYSFYSPDWSSSAITFTCLIGDENTVTIDYFEVFPDDIRSTIAKVAGFVKDLTPA